MSGKQYLLGIDLGTSSTKAGLYSTDGILVAVATVDVPILYPQAGVVEQDMTDFYLSAAHVVQQVIQSSGTDPKDVAALAISSQMAGVGFIDEDFKPVGNFDSWLDMRCQPFVDELRRNHQKRITALTGCPPTCNHGPKLMWWQENQPEYYRQIAKFIMPSAYVAGKMTGISADDAYIDYTFLHFTTMVDAQNGVWSEDLREIIGISREKLPRIVEPCCIVGEVTDEAAQLFGLVAGIPVAAGCGDTAAGALGAGIVHPGKIFDIAGTASVFAATTDTFVADVKHSALLTMRSVIPDLWHPLAYIAGGGQAIIWYRDQFFNTKNGKTQVIDDDLFLEMTQLASEIAPGSDGLFFSPHLGGRICPASPEMRGAWIGFSFSHTRAHFARAILESIGYEYAYYLRCLRETLPDIQVTETRVIGGGAQSKSWNQIKADILGTPYQTINRTEVGTWGAAMIAGKAIGIYADLVDVATQCAQPSQQSIMPDIDKEIHYRASAERYQQLQTVLETLF
ncbi:MAG: FGGY family carbohydrate kinase [Aggregatilineales bacterium]